MKNLKLILFSLFVGLSMTNLHGGHGTLDSLICMMHPDLPEKKIIIWGEWHEKGRANGKQIMNYIKTRLKVDNPLVAIEDERISFESDEGLYSFLCKTADYCKEKNIKYKNITKARKFYNEVRPIDHPEVSFPLDVTTLLDVTTKSIEFIEKKIQSNLLSNSSKGLLNRKIKNIKTIMKNDTLKKNKRVETLKWLNIKDLFDLLATYYALIAKRDIHLFVGSGHNEGITSNLTDLGFKIISEEYGLVCNNKELTKMDAESFFGFLPPKIAQFKKQNLKNKILKIVTVGGGLAITGIIGWATWKLWNKE